MDYNVSVSGGMSAKMKKLCRVAFGFATDAPRSGAGCFTSSISRRLLAGIAYIEGVVSGGR
jgi:hypothetical protein